MNPLLAFQSPGPMRGDWVFALSGAEQAGGGRTVPFSGELWAAPLAVGPAIRVAHYLDRDEFGGKSTNMLERQLSADGRRIVLSVGVGAGARTRFRIVLIDLDRATMSTVGEDDADHLRPALSPDGTRIAYIRQPATGPDDGLWVMNADGSNARRLRPGVRDLFTWTFGWTPDSRRIAFDQVGSVPSYVLVDVATGAVSGAAGFVPALYVGEPVDWRARAPSFVAGFASQAFDGDYRIVVADSADGPQRVIVRESNHFLAVGVPRWHPSSDEILYRRLISVASIEFYVVAAAGGAPSRVPLSVRPYLADWTPDGTGIVYLSQDPTGGSFYGISIRLARRDGSGDRELAAVPRGGLSDLTTRRYPP